MSTSVPYEISNSDSDADLPLTPISTTGSTSSGLPTSYYERYTRNYNLGERQRQRELQEAKRTQQEVLRGTKSMEQVQSSNYRGGGGTSSSVATSDHLETAVENLYRMVERKVSTEQTRLPSQYPVPSSSNTRPNHQRTNSWTSTAIHSEVSKLYHMGVATASPTSNHMRAMDMGGATGTSYNPYGTADRGDGGTGGGTLTNLWRSARGIALEDGEITTKERGSRSKGESGIPCDLLLFLYGFILPPLWWIGAFRSEPTKYRKWCRIMSVLGTLVYVAVVVVLLLLFVFRKR